MRAFLVTLWHYRRRHLVVYSVLFAVTLFCSYFIQSPRYEVQGVVEIGRTPLRVNGALGIELVMSSELSKQWLEAPGNAGGGQSAVHVGGGHLGVRVSNESFLSLRATADSPETAQELYHVALERLISAHESIFRERIDYWSKVHDRMLKNIAIRDRLVSDLKSCRDLTSGEDVSACVALRDRIQRSLETDAHEEIKLGAALLPSHAYPTREIGRPHAPKEPVYPDLSISLLFAFYVGLLGVASYNLLLLFFKPTRRRELPPPLA